jgi:hypothetical protein
VRLWVSIEAARRAGRGLVHRLVLPAVLAAAVALAAPLPASAAAGETLSVNSSLGMCGHSGDAVWCRIDASFSGVAGADYYTASVTAPDGTVSKWGSVAPPAGTGPGSASIWTPAGVGGSYTITVSAWSNDSGQALSTDAANSGQ